MSFAGAPVNEFCIHQFKGTFHYLTSDEKQLPNLILWLFLFPSRSLSLSFLLVLHFSYNIPSPRGDSLLGKLCKSPLIKFLVHCAEYFYPTPGRAHFVKRERKENCFYRLLDCLSPTLAGPSHFCYDFLFIGRKLFKLHISWLALLSLSHAPHSKLLLPNYKRANANVRT